jgi:hypothetical protein
MPNNGYFDCKQDNELIATGTHFWCQTCLIARPIDDQSPDSRYCQSCYEFLLKEAEMLPGNKRPAWIPKKPEKAGKKQYPILGYPTLIMAGINNKENHTCQKHTEDGRGRPSLDLPIDLIKKLQDAGCGVTEIRRQLKDKGIKVKERTLYRILKKGG